MILGALTSNLEPHELQAGQRLVVTRDLYHRRTILGDRNATIYRNKC
jgi:hypothetical protein